jgi:galactose mutarotase-like enzyme
MKENFLKIETIKNGQEEVSFCPERGGIITSLKLKNKEVLYFDEKTFNDIDIKVRGGIPVLFPNTGVLNDSSLPRHGFARDLEWQNEKSENGFKETLFSNEETRKIYPYDFYISIAGNFEKDGSFTLFQEIENKEDGREMLISAGLHPYFKVSDAEKNNIKFDFEGGEIAQNKVEDWSDDEYISIDNPKIKDPNALLKILIPNLGMLIIDIPVDYQKIWIWSMSGRDFFCIEPVMRDVNGFLDNPKKLKPKETFKLKVNFKLE